MPLISYFYGISIYMYFREHGQPHFHAEYGEFEAKIDIQTLEIIKGQLPKRALKLIQEWGRSHQKELLDNWERATLKCLKPTKIKPLK